MAKKFSARWKATGKQPGNSTMFTLTGCVPQDMAEKISTVFFKVYRDEMIKNYPEIGLKPKPCKLSINITFPDPL